MSIHAIGTPADLRSPTGSGTPVTQPAAAPGTSAYGIDTTLPATAQVPAVGDVAKAVDALNRYIPLATHNLTFSIDDESGKVIVKVLDGDTETVIRQIPSEEALALSRSLNQNRGVLLNGKV